MGRESPSRDLRKINVNRKRNEKSGLGREEMDGLEVSGEKYICLSLIQNYIGQTGRRTTDNLVVSATVPPPLGMPVLGTALRVLFSRIAA